MVPSVPPEKSEARELVKEDIHPIAEVGHGHGCATSLEASATEALAPAAAPEGSELAPPVDAQEARSYG